MRMDFLELKDNRYIHDGRSGALLGWFDDNLKLHGCGDVEGHDGTRFTETEMLTMLLQHMTGKQTRLG